jgi:hypothetical protein
MISEKQAGWLHLASCPRERGICFACCTIKRITLAVEFYHPFLSNLREDLIRDLLSSIERGLQGLGRAESLSMLYFRRRMRARFSEQSIPMLDVCNNVPVIAASIT